MYFLSENDYQNKLIIKTIGIYNRLKRSTTMTKNIMEYGHFKRVNDPKIIEKIRELNIDCETIPPKKYYEACKLLGINTLH